MFNSNKEGYKMHCVNCDRLLSDFEATRKHAITFQFLDLCKVCFEDVKTIIPTIDNRSLMTEQDLDVDDDEADLEDLSEWEDLSYLVEKNLTDD
jgi:hypothetical protein